MSFFRLLLEYLALLEPPMERTTMGNPNRENIWLQPGTRAHMLVYKGDHWQVWVATNSRSGDSANWLGTYMEVYPNGKCIQCMRTEVEYNEIVIRSSMEDYSDE